MNVLIDCATLCEDISAGISARIASSAYTTWDAAALQASFNGCAPSTTTTFQRAFVDVSCCAMASKSNGQSNEQTADGVRWPTRWQFAALVGGALGVLATGAYA